MRAIDTNIVVRFLIDGDDADQAARARSVVAAGDVFVPTTVLLESAWVLRSTFGFKRAEVVQALRAFEKLPAVSVEDVTALADALDWVEAGMDFADALHLANAEGCSAFLSFDRRLAKVARGRSPIPVEEP